MTPDLYRPADSLTDDSDLYTLAEVQALLLHHDLHHEVQVLQDGRVIRADWDPSDGDPDVYAVADMTAEES